MPVIKRIFKTFDGKPVIEGLSIELPDRGVICLMGPSGCGKTTLLRLLSGLIAPDSGMVDGLSGKRAAFVFQEDRLLEPATVIQNIEAVLNKGDPNGEKWLGIVGLSDDAGAFPRDLSGGMRRKVALARALAFGGDVYYMDEPFRGIDAMGREALIPKIRTEIKDKLAFVVTHDINEARLVGDYIVTFGNPPLSAAGITAVNEMTRNATKIPQINDKERE